MSRPSILCLFWCAMAVWSASAEAEAPAPSGRGGYEIDEYVIDGNSVLSEHDIDEAVYPFLGPDRGAEDVEHARAALEKAYHDAGYQTVQIAVANAEPDEGAVHFTVTEYHVGRLRVVGSRYYDLDDIKKEAPSVAPGSVPNLNTLQDDIVALNELPHRQVTPSLKAGKRPNTVDVDLIVKDDPPLRFNLEVNNQRSVATSPLRIVAGVDYDNLFQLGHSLSATAIVAPENPDDALVVIASYGGRIARTPLGWKINFLKSDSDVATVGATDVVGKGFVVGAGLTIDLPSDDTISQNGELTVAYKDYRNDTRAGANTTASTVPATYVPVTASYHAQVHEEGAIDTVDVSLEVVPPRAGSNRAELDQNRYQLRGLDVAFHSTLERLQDIYAGFQADARLSGQLSDAPLVVNEQFPLGGVHSVRGYYEGELLADSGYAGSFEILSPPLAPLLPDEVKDTLQEWRLFGFIDGGFGIIHDALPGQTAQFQLSSYGVGMTAKMLDRFTGSLTAAFPIAGTTNTAANKPQLLFSVATEY